MIGWLNDEVFKLIGVHDALGVIRYAAIYCLTVFGFRNVGHVEPQPPPPLLGQRPLKKQNRLATALMELRGKTAEICALKVYIT